MPTFDIPDSVVKWLAAGERGISSESMVSHIYGWPVSRWGLGHPYDPDDLRRCLLLLQASPETRTHLPQMATASKQWKALVERWDELERLFIEECGGSLHSCFGRSAPKTYAAMKEALTC